MLNLLDKRNCPVCGGILKCENVDTGHPSIEWYEQRHQDDCIRINELTVTVDTLVDRYANLRKNKGMC
nr:MAG: hypothetical protein [Bacteriophage sp.]